jgi:hypothetical protein
MSLINGAPHRGNVSQPSLTASCSSLLCLRSPLLKSRPTGLAEQGLYFATEDREMRDHLLHGLQQFTRGRRWGVHQGRSFGIRALSPVVLLH